MCVLSVVQGYSNTRLITLLLYVGSSKNLRGRTPVEIRLPFPVISSLTLVFVCRL
jgi:hypothetical protein